MSNEKRKGDLVGKDTPFAITEAYRTARTNIMFSLSTSKKKIMVVTSSNPTEGKSTTCANMGLILAEMGASVLIIDADMRKPTIHKQFSIPNVNGLSSILGGLIDAKIGVNENVAENLDVITAGIIPPNPAGLLSSDFMANFLSALSEHYDYILIDTPPINVVTDSQLLNGIVSGILFVVREGVTTHNDIAAALRSVEMANGNILGFFKVGCSYGGARGYKKYKYKYKYDYSYGTPATATGVQKEIEKV
ncbi:MAG: CpsD/CapB family tyrosine-protein kinase [Clostridiales bacterium]|jgi:capsular exopolysaccharide synthesis family protein|nr:CpsD/CapB family tyrosine-protein kinase [Clostridiales bacterium]